MIQKADLWSQVISWENLLLAYRRAATRKRSYYPAAEFEYHLADNLLALQEELIDKTYQPGAYQHFYVHEPKRRKISAAPFRDRVIHHALCNIIEPLFDRLFFPHSYANRRGKGTHAAVDYLQACAQKYRYVLRADIVKHFPSLDHAVLRSALTQVIDDTEVLWLIDRILASAENVLADEYEMVYFPGDDLFAVNRPRGLPIGNLTSQFWSNCYMNAFDWFVNRELCCPAYLRYVDDFALFSNSKRDLWAYKRAIEHRLSQYRLTIHDGSQVRAVAEGVPWLGWLVRSHLRRLKRRKVVHFQRGFQNHMHIYSRDKATFQTLDAYVKGWINYARYGDTWRLRSHLLG